MPNPTTVADILWAATERAPRSTALIHGERTWSFADLADATCGLVDYLGDAGIRPGEPVALLMHNSPGFVVAHYALASLGAVVVPLNTQLHGRQLGETLDLCEATCVLTSSGSLETLRSIPTIPAAVDRCLLLDDGIGPHDPLTVGMASPDFEADPAAIHPLGESPRSGLASRAAPTDAAILFFTSGTTGTPKGIRVTHRQALLGLDAWAERWSFGPRTISLMVAPFFHVVYNPLVLGAHRRGGTAVVLDNLQTRAALREVERTRATAVMGTPFFYMQLLNDSSSRSYDLSSIDAVIYGAAPTPVPTVGALRRRFPDSQLFNCYGLTETCSALSCLGSNELDGHEASVGRAHPGVEVSIRAEDHRELATGESGEVYCRGPNVITSYYKAPEANASRFHDGWLRTGDIGYLDADEFLYLQGRSDDQINVGGDKSYPCDIENVLHAHADVLDAAVAAKPDPVRGQQVKAFVVPRSRGALDLRSLRRFCRERLPAPFVPRSFALLDELPRNASGKVLRSKLGDDPEVR